MDVPHKPSTLPALRYCQASHEFTVVKFREYYSDVFNRHASRVLEWLDTKLGRDIDVQDMHTFITRLPLVESRCCMLYAQHENARYFFPYHA